VSSSDVEVVRRFTTSLATGELETCRALVAEDLVFSEAPSLPFGGDRTGKQGMLDLLTAVGSDYRVRLAEPVIDQAGDRVLVRVSGTISSRATRREMPLEALDLYEVRDGLIARIDVFYKDAAAVTALREPATETGVA
jgi:ketosteroid isomerase-like protein